MIRRLSTIVMVVLLALYLVFTAQYAILLIADGDGFARALGVALLVLPLVGAWALTAELLFFRRGQRLLAVLGEEGRMPLEDLPVLPSGRADAKAAVERFPEFKAEAEQAPDDWRSWARLSLAYDACADRGRARWAMRRAITLHRAG